MKHCLSCLIYYIKDTTQTAIQLQFDYDMAVLQLQFDCDYKNSMARDRIQGRLQDMKDKAVNKIYLASLHVLQTY